MEETKYKFYDFSFKMGEDGVNILKYALREKRFDIIEPLLEEILKNGKEIEEPEETN